MKKKLLTLVLSFVLFVIPIKVYANDEGNVSIESKKDTVSIQLNIE